MLLNRDKHKYYTADQGKQWTKLQITQEDVVKRMETTEKARNFGQYISLPCVTPSMSRITQLIARSQSYYVHWLDVSDIDDKKLRGRFIDSHTDINRTSIQATSVVANQQVHPMISPIVSIRTVQILVLQE
jgi:hypothetical protein